MFKQLSPEDYVVDYAPLITPLDAADGSVGVDYYDTGQGDINGTLAQKQVYRQFANIIQGDSESNLPVGSSFYYLTFKRNNFRESIHPATFETNGTRVNTGSSDVNFSEAGRVYSNGNLYLYPDIGVALKNSSFSGVYACSEETITISYAFVRAESSEFNYSTNPTFQDSNDYVRFTDWVNNPVTYITTIGFYNDNGDCLAVAKLPKPFKKNFTTEFLASVQFKF